MRVLITGGGGLIGRALAAELARDGHEVVILSRAPERLGVLPESVRGAAWDGRTPAGWGGLIEPRTAIIHLAGESIAEGRWTPARKSAIRRSRVESGEAVLAAVREAGAGRRPAVLLQASAVGYYGDRGDDEIRESDPPGSDFLAEVAVAWEASTAQVESLGVRRVVLRSAAVLAREAGALPELLRPFRLGLGGPLGGGRQWLPWIHLGDEVGAIRFLLESQEARGPFHLTAPEAVTNATFSRTLGRAIHRPSLTPVPGFALRLAVGEMAEALLASQRVLPSRLLASGFSFRFPALAPALADLVT